MALKETKVELIEFLNPKETGKLHRFTKNLPKAMLIKSNANLRLNSCVIQLGVIKIQFLPMLGSIMVSAAA